MMRSSARCVWRSVCTFSPLTARPSGLCDRREARSYQGFCAHYKPVRLSWARLLKRVFEIDLKHCPNGGGELKIIAAIMDAPVIVPLGQKCGEMSCSVSWLFASHDWVEVARANGYSLLELERVRIDRAAARRLGIPVDPARTTSIGCNVMQLRATLEQNN
jgi:hypothetical protein